MSPLGAERRLARDACEVSKLRAHLHSSISGGPRLRGMPKSSGVKLMCFFRGMFDNPTVFYIMKGHRGRTVLV